MPSPSGLILLLRADDNLVLFLNQQRQPLPGTADFSYTLDAIRSQGRGPLESCTGRRVRRAISKQLASAA